MIAIPIVVAVVLTRVEGRIATGSVDTEEVLDLVWEMARIVGVFVFGQAGEVPALFAGHGGRTGSEELRHDRKPRTVISRSPQGPTDKDSSSIMDCKLGEIEPGICVIKENRQRGREGNEVCTK